jgi:hypothetical protein
MNYTRPMIGAALSIGLCAGFMPAQTALTVSGDIPVAIPEQDGTKIAYESVPLREILKRAGVPLGKDLRGKAFASYVLAKAKDGYDVAFTLWIPGTAAAGFPER